MIEADNYEKITENYRNLPENSLKNPKILSPRFVRGWGVRLRRTEEVFANFSDDKAVFAWPPIGHVW